MAEYSDVIMRVTGPKTACLAFLLSTNWADVDDDLEEYFSEENHSVDESPFSILFTGSVSWYLDAYSEKNYRRNQIVLKSGDRDYLETVGEKYSEYNTQSRSKIFGVDVRVNEVDVGALMEYGNHEDTDTSSGVVGNYRHYDKGEKINDDCPAELLIDVSDAAFAWEEDFDEEDYE